MLRLFKKKLPHCDTLFEKFFGPWYDEEDKRKTTRPDMFRLAAYIGEPLELAEMQYLADDYIIELTEHINVTMVDASIEDFQRIMGFDKFALAVLDAVDKYYDRSKIQELIAESDPTDFSNPYMVTVCEFGVMLGHLFKQRDGFDWLYSHPYFNSIIVHKESGLAIPVFDWAIKKFSEYGVDDGFVGKFHAALAGVRGHEDEQ